MDNCSVNAAKRIDVRSLCAFILIGIGYIAYLWIVIPALVPRFFPDIHASVSSMPDIAWFLARDFVLCSLFPLAAYALASGHMEPAQKVPRAQRKRNVAILATASLLIILIYAFFGQKTLDGFYNWLRIPLFVAQSEELLYRGVIFWGVYVCLGKQRDALVAACVISGALWGAVHGVLPALEFGGGMLSFALSNIGGGIVAGFFFAMAFLKTGSLSVPIAIHALLDCLSIV